MTVLRFPAMLLMLALALWPASAGAGGAPPDELIAAGMPPDLLPFATNVSGSEGDWGSVNGSGCVGAFQFCPGTFERYYGGSHDQFREDPHAQVDAWLRYQRDEWSKAQNNGLTSAIGHEVCWNGTCATIDESAILKACQFGCGSGGKLDNFVRNGFNCDGPHKTSDGAGTSVCRYLVSGAGHNVAGITGNASPETGGVPDPGAGPNGVARVQGTALVSIDALAAAIDNLRGMLGGKLIAITRLKPEYNALILALMGAIATIYAAIALTRYVFDKDGLPTLLGAAARLGIVMAMFVSYAATVEAISRGAYEIAGTIQRATLQSDDVFAAFTYLSRTVTTIQMPSSPGDVLATPGADSAWSSAVLAIVFLVIEGVCLCAIAWAVLWPLVYFFALKLLGLAMLPFLLAGRLEFLFDGWLKQFLMLTVYVLVVNAILAAIVLLVAAAFNLPVHSGPQMGHIVVSGFLGLVLVPAILLFGVLALFRAPRIAASWTGADAMTSGVVSTLLRLLTKGIVR